MKYLSLLKDSWVEALDRKSMWFLVVVSVLVIGFCGSIGFRELGPEPAVDYLLSEFPQVVRFQGGGVRVERFQVQFEKSGFRKLGAGEGDYEGGAGFELTASPDLEYYRLVHAWGAQQRAPVKKVPGATPAPDPPVVEPEAEEQERFVRARFRESGISRVDVKLLPRGEGPRRFQVRLRPTSLKTFEGAYEVSVFFGLIYKGRLTTSVGTFLATVQYMVADWIAGWLGVILAVIFTANSVPNMLQKGSLDLLLSKPVRRSGLLLTKYFGGLLYVLVPATFLIGGCWLVLSARSGFWSPGFLMCIPTLVAVFGILYSFSVLVGVVFRSTIASILLTLLLWFMSYGINSARNMIHMMGWNVPTPVVKALDVMHYLLPMTNDIGQLTYLYLAKSNLGADFQPMVEEYQSKQILLADPWTTVGCSVAFVAVMLGTAIWVFRRRDY